MATWVRVPISITGAGLGGVCNNVWTFGIPEEESSPYPSLSDALGALSTFYTDIASLYDADATITAETGYRYDDNVLTELISVAAAFGPISGTGVGTGAPDGLALCVRWRTAQPGRSGRGRTFIGPLASGIAATPEPGSTTLTTLGDAAQELVTASAEPEGWDLQVYSPTDGVSREVISTDVNPEFAYLRSRRT